MKPGLSWIDCLYPRRLARPNLSTLNRLRLPLNPGPAKYVTADFRLDFAPAFLPRPETKPPKNSAATLRNLVLNDIK